MTEPRDGRGDGTDPAEERWPIGFLVFAGLAALYLTIRLVQMAGWLVDRLF